MKKLLIAALVLTASAPAVAKGVCDGSVTHWFWLLWKPPACSK